MSIETPARIAVLGAGPIGLEAALYAHYLGYDVDIYERGRVAENLLQWGHVRLFSPFGMNRSTLGLAALAAHESGWSLPPDDSLLTGKELAERYCLPLAQTDLLADGLHEHTEVVAVGRDGQLKGDYVGAEQREEPEFRLLLRGGAGHASPHAERFATADVVIDCTGTFGNPRRLGPGGLPAIGELAAERHIEYGLPDIPGRDRQRYAHQHTLVIGSGYSAATSVVALAELARQAPYTSATWVTRGENFSSAGPVRLLEGDRLPERDRLARKANGLALARSDHVTHWPATSVEAVQYQGDPPCFTVRLNGQHAGEIQVARIIANVGYRPDSRLYAELQVHECYATEAPMRLAAALMPGRSQDCLDQTTHGPETLLNPEPDFYILGAKSFGRDSRFLISTGLEQIRELFTILVDRPDLNLYASPAPV